MNEEKPRLSVNMISVGVFGLLLSVFALFMSQPWSSNAGYVDAEPNPCAIWVPDVGDAEENRLLGTEGGIPVVAIAPDGTIIEIPVWMGFDFFQIPEEFMTGEYEFAVQGCSQTFTLEDFDYYDPEE
jgi:hypothetical protein